MNVDYVNFFRVMQRLVAKGMRANRCGPECIGHVVAGDKCPVRKRGKKKVRR
jgi:hypothetical protein